MKKLLTLALALAVAVSFSGAAFAAHSSKPMAKMAAAHKKVSYKTFKGSVVSVDQTANTIVVKGAGKKATEETFSVAPSTRLSLKKKAAALADFVAGTKVSVSYSVDNGKNVASAIK